MKKWLFDLILYIFCFVFVAMFFTSVSLPNEVAYLILAFLAIGLGMMLAKKILTFLTIKVVFLTRLVAITLLLFGIFYALQIFLPGFLVGNMIFEETEWGFLSLKAFEFDKIGVMALLSFFTAFVSSLVKLLQEN